MTCSVQGDGTRELPPVSQFATDDGAADPTLASTLADYEAGRSDLGDVVTVLSDARVLLPVLAHGPRTADGSHEVATSVATVPTSDGRNALPVFTSVSALARWRSDSRPMPVTAQRAAASALADGHPLLMVDPGGPVTVVVPRPAVQSLAAGIAWHPAVLSGHLRPEVRDAVETAVATVPGVRSVNAEPGQRAEVAVIVGLERGLDRDSLSAVLAQVNTALAASPLASQVDSVELRPLAVG